MRKGQLSDRVLGTAAKVLSAVETQPRTSNQHEFNGSLALRRLLGDDDRIGIPTRFIWLGEEEEAVSVEGELSWYDARRKHLTRTEYRLYYPSNEVTRAMKAGDAFFLVMMADGSLLLVVAPSGGTIQNQLCWLFGMEHLPEKGFSYQSVDGGHDPVLDFGTRYVLDELGIEIEEPGSAVLDGLIEPFGTEFPKTKEFSHLARSSLPDVSAPDDPDTAVVMWMEREEQLFRRLERKVVRERIAKGFGTANDVDVDGFLHFSLSVQNRRKARAGQALENHLEAVFQSHGLQYSRGARTENRNRPDFLFPGEAAYHDGWFPRERLTMLGVKSTLKDRWRQVLSEADHIPEKHLLTLEPGISEHQTAEMQAKGLQLVIPERLHESFRPGQRDWLMSLSEFIDLVRRRQTAG